VGLRPYRQALIGPVSTGSPHVNGPAPLQPNRNARSWRHAAYLYGAIILAFFITRPAADTEASELRAEGRAIYARQCSRCHGFNMNNKGLPGYDLRKFPKTERDRFVSSVRRGKLPKMPPWGDVLSADEIEALWVYVQAGGGP
jgi:mono/diheme cytochrome c family protein